MASLAFSWLLKLRRSFLYLEYRDIIKPKLFYELTQHMTKAQKPHTERFDGAVNGLHPINYKQVIPTEYAHPDPFHHW